VSPDTRYAIMRLMKATEPDADGAVNALLATSFVYRDLVPITQTGTHQFEPGGKVWDERAGQMRGKHGWLFAPSYTTSVDDAMELVRTVFDGEKHTLTIEAKPEFATARILWRHGSTGWHTCASGQAARAIIFALLEVLDKNDPTADECASAN